MVWNISCLPSPVPAARGEAAGGSVLRLQSPQLGGRRQMGGRPEGSLSTILMQRRVYVDLQPRHHWGGILEARQVMGDGLLRVAEIRTERRMEPANEGEGIYRFASVGKS